MQYVKRAAFPPSPRPPQRRSAARLRRALALGLLGAALAPASAAEDAPTGPLTLLSPSERGLRSDVAWLVDRGVLDQALGTWPIASSTLRAAWASVDARALDAADADALARVQRAVARSSATVRLAALGNSGRHPALDGGDAAKGSASGSLSFYGGGEQWGAQLTLGTTAESLTPDGPHGNADGSYLALLLPGTVVAAGVVDRWWGPGQFASPILSNAARPIAGLFVRRAQDLAPETDWLRWVGAWGYEVSAGRLAGYDPDGTRTIGLRLYTRPWPNVEIGLARSILWAGAGRPHDLNALRNALLGRSNVSDPATQGGDPSNEVAGLDLRVSAPNPWGGSWVAYLHVIGEDEAAGVPSKRFGTLGLQAKAVIAGQRWEATLEATDTTLARSLRSGNSQQGAPAYTHSVYVDGYYQGRLPIGAAIGGGASLATLGLAWTSIGQPQQLRVYGSVFSGQMSRPGPQSINAAFGAPGALRGFTLGVDGESAAGVKWIVGVSMQRYSGGGRPLFSLQAGIDVPLVGPR